MGLTPRDMFDAMLRNIPQKTGKSVDEWIALVKKYGPESTPERIRWLKEKHKLGAGYAMAIASSAGKPPDFAAKSAEQLLDEQYAGDKAALRPIYAKVAREVLRLGKDIELDPRQTYVSIIRGRQIGLVQASTTTRVDLGLRLKGVAPNARLQAAGSFGSGSITHKVAIASVKDVD